MSQQFNNINDFLLRETPSQLAKLLQQRMSLDRRRLEEGFLLYASLVTLEKNNLWEQVPAIPCDRNKMVELVTREFNIAFIKRWGGEQLFLQNLSWEFFLPITASIFVKFKRNL